MVLYHCLSSEATMISIEGYKIKFSAIDGEITSPLNKNNCTVIHKISVESCTVSLLYNDP